MNDQDTPPTEPDSPVAKTGSDSEVEATADDALDEALEESFPASDPPSSSNFD